jgi:hypothetical protein
MDMSHHDCYIGAVAIRRRILDYIAANPEGADYNDMIVAFITPLDDIDEIELLKAQTEGVSIGMELAGEVTFTDGGRMAVRA